MDKIMYRIIYSITKTSIWGHVVGSEVGITNGEYECIEGARNELSRRLLALTKRTDTYSSRIIKGGYKKDEFDKLGENKFTITPLIKDELIVINKNKNTKEKTTFNYKIVEVL